MKTIRDFNVRGNRILLRCDFNVPLNDTLEIADDFRIKKSLPTIQYLLQQGAKVIIISHLDPVSQGVVSSQFSLAPVAKRLSELLSKPVAMAPDCIGQEVKSMVHSMEDGQVILLENVRFHAGETANDALFAKELSELGDIFVNDAFSVCHRAHASVAGLAAIMPNAAGFLLEQEIENLDKILKNPEKPMVALIGGAKVQTKAKLIESLAGIADAVIVSGLIKQEMQDAGLKFNYQEKIMGPAKNLTALDINQDAIDLFCQKIMMAKTILWNGPFGKFEDQEHKRGTLLIAKAIVESKAFSVVGGGETVEFIAKEGLLEQFSWVSTGGGAMLSYLSGQELPGLKVLI